MTNIKYEPETRTLGKDYSATYLAPFSIVMAIVIASIVARIYDRMRPPQQSEVNKIVNPGR
ncbi:hypothetical protein NW761_014375 [Fusarium oxysporum]|nr:hypothetical protein NW758_015158 [Fusarium oxysporum]KAJ4050855.1 hypothetical protein NW753_007461 [Fusarium oxysporum]KAJ4073206.1 hypothetical protein NW761_014375 [Fusarium oxysporum]WKT53569.1 hypothetical protein QSH57_004131 [Fusarium oxysporum f. sp. vasinfectum]